MPAQVTNYKCPACDGTLAFDPATGKLKCEYCMSTYETEQMEQLYAEKEAAAQQNFQQARQEEENRWDDGDLSGDWGEDAQRMRAYLCNTCGAQILCDETTAATSCPYCGNTTVIPGQFSGTLKPDFVIPFKLDKQAAVAALKAHYKGKALLPRSFRDSNHIQSIRGIYVPFWLFSGKADADASFTATRSHVHRSGDYEITTTHHYRIHRAGIMHFDKIPVDASTKMPDDHMDSIEPFDYTELTEFSTAYLPGFLADKYDVDAQQSAQRADARCIRSAVEALTDTVTGYDSVVCTSEDVALERGKIQYALLPVWLLNTKWKGKEFLFAMNGQTGRLVGDLPVSWLKFWAWFAGIAIPLAVITALIVL